MVCKSCGSEFNIENFDMCPYCLTPVVMESVKTEFDSAFGATCNENNMYEGDSEIELATTEKAEVEEDYIVTADDLFEDDDARNTLEEIPIDELGLSARAVNSFRRAKINTLNELVGFLTDNSVSDLRNVGAKTVKETEELIEKVRSGELAVLRMNSDKDTQIVERTIFENISIDVDYLSIDALIEIGLTNKAVSNLRKHKIKCCGELRRLSRKELIDVLGYRFVDRLPDVATLLKKDIVSLLEYVLKQNSDSREFEVYLRRSQGETLEEIAKNPSKNAPQITRERVRQMEKTYAETVKPFIRELLHILKGGNIFIPVQDLLEVFDDDEYDQVILYACKGFEEFEFLDFADVFVEKQESGSVEQKIFDIIKDIVGEGIDLEEIKETINDILSENQFDYINLDSIINLLNKNKYHMFGTFAVKGRSHYAPVCLYVIKKYFPGGIKLSQNITEHTEDLLKLRGIIEENYPGVTLPSSDRALSSTLVRNGLILRGRGSYILQDQIVVDEGLIEEIKKYIDSKDNDKIFYNEIFAEYEGTLNALCGIDNYNFLHGVLSMIYPNAYEYERDYLLKNGISDATAEGISDRIYNYICEMGRPVSKSELVNRFKGFSNVMITMPFVNDSRLMQWEHNMFSCLGILNIDEDDLVELKKIIYELFESNKGYASDGLLYDELMSRRPQFIKNNQIKSEMNLHYVVAKILENEMDFKRPHIGKKGVINLTSTKEVALYLLGNPEQFTFGQYSDMVEHMKWSRVTASAVLSDIERDYYRISVDNYIKKETLVISSEIKSLLEKKIEERMSGGILSLINFETDDFKDFDYLWNEFLVESIIKKCCYCYEVVHPIIKVHIPLQR